eukprot:m.180199 g.180199  ORF g.180199 m.180199 type:complete len:179 (-) comp53441_c0_seq22:151-687(-)
MARNPASSSDPGSARAVIPSTAEFPWSWTGSTSAPSDSHASTRLISSLFRSYGVVLIGSRFICQFLPGVRIQAKTGFGFFFLLVCHSAVGFLDLQEMCCQSKHTSSQSLRWCYARTLLTLTPQVPLCHSLSCILLCALSLIVRSFLPANHENPFYRFVSFVFDYECCLFFFFFFSLFC